MVAKILDHNNKELKQGRRRQQLEWQKKLYLYISKTTNLHVHHAFFLPTWNFLISRARSMELVNTAQKLSFSKLRHVTFAFNPREFRQDLTN